MRKFLLSFVLLTLMAASCQKPLAKVDTSAQQPKQETKLMLTLTSPAFLPGESIPKKYTCQGEGVNPPVSFENIPANTKSLALIVDDPDVPKNLLPSGVFDHWVVFNMPPSTTYLAENSTPPGTLGNNGRGQAQYTPPCPPNGEHRYFFRLYALDITLDLKQGATKQQVLDSMQGHIIEQAELMGRYIKS